MSAPPIAIFAHDKKAETHAESRAWLKSRVSSPPSKAPLLHKQTPVSRKGATQTMYKSSVYQNSLQAVPFPQHLSGYKDPLDCSHKSDKSAFISSYNRAYGPIDDKPVKFRDGMPIDARRISGKPLMAPKPPNLTQLNTHKKLAARNQASHFEIGDHSKKDPRHYSTMSSLFHSKPHRMLSQPNPEIAADASRRQHSKLGIHPETRRR
ncbi:TPA: hypothetical protein ACH3X1_003254 [Trebouxia sp. C0004]